MASATSGASLPRDPSFRSDDEYITSLLTFATSSELFQRLCGGVHIVDSLTKEPDLYSTILPLEWRDWFDSEDISDILDLLMREEVSVLDGLLSAIDKSSPGETRWRNGRAPPASLLEYVLTIRRHSLDRTFTSNSGMKAGENASLQCHVAVGMKPKKVHEVQNFTKYIDGLSKHIAHSSPHRISHIIDFGSGQSYLGRALASPPFNKRVVALESKLLNIDGARNMDIHAKLAEKQKVIRNKKQYRSQVNGDEISANDVSPSEPARSVHHTVSSVPEVLCEKHEVSKSPSDEKITYIETLIQNGDLTQVIQCVPRISFAPTMSEPQFMVVSLHSCGNLLHHGVRSLILNPSVKAIAMVGCCYNLVTERLGPPTYKLPSLRVANSRLDSTSSASDPHGFPMSQKLATFQHSYGHGLRLNITARMMAVQAPQNWTKAESEAFFTRHFYRALLQKLFVDRGLVSKPCEADDKPDSDTSTRGCTSNGTPITIGSLRKACYVSFTAYVCGALKKLSENSDFAHQIQQSLQDISDAEIEGYVRHCHHMRKALSIVWSLMAFSAGVVESIIVVDRWLYLTEQDEVKECWVETVFDYAQSPRNLVVVGVKK